LAIVNWQLEGSLRFLALLNFQPIWVVPSFLPLNGDFDNKQKVVVMEFDEAGKPLPLPSAGEPMRVIDKKHVAKMIFVTSNTTPTI
jgi:hypothetical protein